MWTWPARVSSVTVDTDSTELHVGMEWHVMIWEGHKIYGCPLHWNIVIIWLTHHQPITLDSSLVGCHIPAIEQISLGDPLGVSCSNNVLKMMHLQKDAVNHTRQRHMRGTLKSYVPEYDTTYTGKPLFCIIWESPLSSVHVFHFANNDGIPARWKMGSCPSSYHETFTWCLCHLKIDVPTNVSAHIWKSLVAKFGL